MTESVITPVAKPVVAFGRRNASEERIKQVEDELEQLKNPQASTEKQEDKEDTSLNAEERTFKKRYGDLRRHSQKQQEDLQKQIDDLKLQLNSATTKQLQIPKTEAEVNAWATQYPDVYKLVKSIAIREAKQQTTSLEERMKKIDEMERNAVREKAEAELMRLHPDFDQIRDDDEFHDWVQEQPDWVQKALYENDNDARAAARAIDLYKSDKGIKAKKTANNKDAAFAISTPRSKPSPNAEGTEGMIYESQVAKMSPNDYEKNAEAIHAAIKAGKFVYDMSGAAR